MIATYTFYFAQPWWLAACALAVPMAWMGLRNLSSLWLPRRLAAVLLRTAVVCLLAMLLARPMMAEKSDQLTVLTVVDRSLSIPLKLQESGVNYLNAALGHHSPTDQLAVVDVAEAASIAKLPSRELTVQHRSTNLTGDQSYLESGVQMAMAIAPPDTATRILLVSDGNETSGDLKEVARTAAANHIPIDVLPLRYNHQHEVVFTRLSAPLKAHSGQTITLRFVLNSTADGVRGLLHLTLNGQAVHLDSTTSGTDAPLVLNKGINVKTVSLPVGTRGIQEFEATFIPDDPKQDEISQNNLASAMTFVAGAGHVLLVDSDGKSAGLLKSALQLANMDVRYLGATQFPSRLSDLLDTDCIILCDSDNGDFTLQQQDMLCRYVSDMGGGLIMTGGPHAFGAGGWIGSPVASILPVDMDPPQKEQMPKGALVLIMHACEMPDGNMWGKKTALAAINTLSRLDMAGVLSYSYNSTTGDWVYPLKELGNKQAIIAAIQQMDMGDMPDFGSPMQAAFTALKASNAGQKHIIIISDGDPAPPSQQLIKQLQDSAITCSGVAYFAHDANCKVSLQKIAQATKGRFYEVTDPEKLPQIFIKEAQVVRRALIVEETFTPKISFSVNELIKGISALPQLDGYVLTGPGTGLSQTVLKSKQGDPVLATGQFGLGRVVAFTSSVDTRWAAQWTTWSNFKGFWEQAVRWCGKSATASDCEIFADVQDRRVDVTVEAAESGGNLPQLNSIGGQVISPDMAVKELSLNQVGPGRYHAVFQAKGSGSYLVNLQYTKPGSTARQMVQSVVTVPYAPEFKDLSDNAALLAELASMTGGRIIQNDPAAANLFDRAGVVFPETALPLTKELSLLWLALFLLDVAVRRIAVDWRALGRRLMALAPRRTGKQKDQTIDRLQVRREQVRKQMDSRAKEVASRHFVAAPGATGELPTTQMAPPPAERSPAQGQSQTPAPPPKQDDDSTMGRLLKAKRKAGDGMHGKDKTQQ